MGQMNLKGQTNQLDQMGYLDQTDQMGQGVNYSEVLDGPDGRNGYIG